MKRPSPAPAPYVKARPPILARASIAYYTFTTFLLWTCEVEKKKKKGFLQQWIKLR